MDTKLHQLQSLYASLSCTVDQASEYEKRDDLSSIEREDFEHIIYSLRLALLAVGRMAQTEKDVERAMEVWDRVTKATTTKTNEL